MRQISRQDVFAMELIDCLEDKIKMDLKGREEASLLFIDNGFRAILMGEFY